MKLIKTLLKIGSSAKLIELLDINGDGRVSWSELKKAKFSDWVQIAGELGLTVLSILYLKG